MPAKILVVDDNLTARNTIRTLLDWHGFQLCGDASNGKEAIERVIEQKPDIVVLDINMPSMSVVAAAQEIRRISPTTKIVFLTIHDEPATQMATRLWGHAFVSRSAAGTDLIPALRRLEAHATKHPVAD